MNGKLTQRLRQALKKYERVPFVHNGRSLETGLDCLGFVVLFYREFGIYLPDNDGRFIEEDWYKTDPERYIRAINRLPGKKVSIRELQPLDLVYFSISRNIITHTGVMISSHEFAHMSPKSNFLISRMERLWSTRFRGALRFDVEI